MNICILVTAVGRLRCYLNVLKGCGRVIVIECLNGVSVNIGNGIVGVGVIIISGLIWV